MSDRHVRTSIKNQELLEKRRRLIAARAIDVFLQNGYESATTREVAQACEMSEGALYRYIGSKYDVLHLIVRLSPRGAHLEALLETLNNVTVTEALRACIEKHLQVAHEGRRRIRLINREIYRFSESDIRYIRESQEMTIRFFETLLIKGIEAGEFQMDSPLAVAHNIHMLSLDWVQRSWFVRQYFTLEDYTKTQTDLILRAIRVDDPGAARTTPAKTSAATRRDVEPGS